MEMKSGKSEEAVLLQGVNGDKKSPTEQVITSEQRFTLLVLLQPTELKSNLKQNPRFVRLTPSHENLMIFPFNQSQRLKTTRTCRGACGLVPTALCLRVNPNLSAQRPYNLSTFSPLLEFPLNSNFFSAHVLYQTCYNPIQYTARRSKKHQNHHE